MSLLSKYADIIKAANPSQITRDTSLGGKLTIGREGKLQVDYAPFDYVNPTAKVALVGITPGRQQATNSLLEANRQLNKGADPEIAARAAKEFASFSGAMRNNLVSCLDKIGLHTWLGIDTTAELWIRNTDLVHFTSGVMYPTYIEKDGEMKNWNGTPKAAKSPLLSSITQKHLADEVRELTRNNAVIVALGPKAAEAIESAQVGPDAIILQVPHPSPASNERISYFAGNRTRQECSDKTNPDTLDAMRAKAINQVLSLCEKRPLVQ